MMAPREPSESGKPGGAAIATVVVLTLAACALRFPSLGRSLWLDEAWRANIALAPTWDAFWSAVLGAGGGGIGAPMAPLFALALRAAGAVVGHSAAGMRALPVLASIAAVPLGFVIGRRAGGTWAGLGAALLFAATPTTLLHGQELKQYSTDIAVVLVLLAAASGVAARPRSAGAWGALAIAESLAPGLAYPTALVLPGIALATLGVCRDNADRVRWLAAHAASALAALAWYVLVIGPQRDRPLVAAYWAADFPPMEGVPGAGWVWAQVLDVVRYCSAEPPRLALLLAVCGFLVSARWLGLAALGTVATSIAAAAWRVYPLSGGRTSVFLLPFLYLGIAGALGAGAALARRRDAHTFATGAVAVVAAFVLGGMALRGVRAPQAGLVYEETAPLIATLEAERQPNDKIYVYDGAVQAFRFHHPAPDPAVTLGGSHRNDERAYAAELRPLLVPGQRLWILFAHVHVPKSGKPERDTILADVGIAGRQIASHDAEGASLHLFEITRAPGQVRHLSLSPEDMKDPARMKELLGR